MCLGAYGRVCSHEHMHICVFWGFFCLFAGSWSGLGLFLSGLIRRSRLHPSLITLLRANIPFIFSVFHSLSPFVVGRLGSVSAFYQLSLSFLSFSSIFSFPLFFFLPLNATAKSLTSCFEWQNTANSS